MNLKYKAILDPDFQPMELVLRDYEARVREGAGQRLEIAVERNKGYCERFDFDILQDGLDDETNFAIVERYIKTLLWVFGGWKIHVSGSRPVYEYLRAA